MTRFVADARRGSQSLLPLLGRFLEEDMRKENASGSASNTVGTVKRAVTTGGGIVGGSTNTHARTGLVV